ncbi:hypothetical protein AV656_08840 [Bhargavaea cecembensis]|uniref:FAD synthase n=1 Tax=Bhargavaea cecembensis TaxID=394098 RepID=A0A161SMB2_9BACL|nr:FAD synthetase family protein [Bhargavaea cecembensis]KZE38993.1 hypothetical protein AV656_08840 [Bhargavaea cecembensis]
MKTISLNHRNLSGWQQQEEPTVMALGCFDGLHHGHERVIQTALRKAREKNLKTSVMTFFPHPRTVLPGRKREFHYLMPQQEKEARLREMGVDTLYVVEFDKKFASLHPEQFVSDYLLGLGVVHAVAGFDFSYGSRGAGNMDRLTADSGYRIGVTKVEKVGIGDQKISSTLIRETLLHGKVEDIPMLLGRPYELTCSSAGETFIPHPHFTIPAPGTYEVSLKTGKTCIRTELTVCERGQLSCRSKLPSLIEGSCSVIWHRALPEERQIQSTYRSVQYGY